MTSSGQPQTLPSVLQSVLDWLAAPLPANPAHDLVALKRFLTEITAAPFPPAQRLRLLALLQARVNKTSEILKPKLIDARLPLPDTLRRIARGLMNVHGIVGNSLLHNLQDLDTSQALPSAVDVAANVRDLAHNLAEQLQVSLLVATAPPVGLWLQVHAAFKLVEKFSAGESQSVAGDVIKGVLALAAVQPESLTAPEIAIIIDFLSEFSAAVSIAAKAEEPADGWFWVEETQDAAPVALARKPAPLIGHVSYVSCAKLAELANQRLAILNDGGAGITQRLSKSAGVEVVRDVLARAHTRWLSPPKRQEIRRTSHYRVEICAPLTRLWQVLGDNQNMPESEKAALSTQWLVLNESANGYAMMHVSGAIDDLVAGDVVGVRTAPDQPWKICLLRWGRSDNPAHIEIGLELASPSGAAPVQIACQPGEGGGEPAVTPSLLLSMSKRQQGEEVLFVARNQLPNRRFTMVKEEDNRFSVTECEVQHMVLQTARVEVVSFRRDYSARR